MATNICRTCIDATGVLPICGENNVLSNMIMCCASIKIHEDDGFSSVICENCYANLQIAYNFRRLCELSDIKLRSPDETASPASEILEDKITDTENRTSDLEESQENSIDLDQNSIKISDDGLYEEIVVADKNINFVILPNEYVPDITNDSYEIVEDYTDDEEPQSQKLNACDQCPYCGKLLYGKGYLKNHIYTHLKIKPHECDICSKEFIQKCHLIRHMKSHTGEKPYQCKECGIKCANLYAHRAVHNDRKFVCEICLRGFKSKNQLKSHIRTHAGGKSVECHLCNKAFYTKSTLNTHLKASHFGEKKYKCKICEKMFAKSSTLSCHLRIHTGERPYGCKLCCMKFNQSSSLRRHMKIHKKSIKQTQNQSRNGV